MTDTVDVANKVLFGDVCSLLDQLCGRKVHVLEKERILIKYIRDFKCTAAEEKVEKKNTSFYPILRLLVPSFERERPAYNLKEPKLGVLLVKILSLSKHSLNAQKLLNRSVTSMDGDFGTVAYFVLKNRVAHKVSSMTVGDINEILDKISAAEVGNKGPILDDLFTKLIKNLTAEQIKWFLRIILKDLKIGMSAKRILACYHPDAPEHYEKYGNLAKVCDELDDGNVRPVEMGVEIFYAVSPMLSERIAIDDVDTLPLDKMYHIEQKFDGERFQIHMENQPTDEAPDETNHVFEYYSRKGFANSSVFGKTYDSGMLTPHLKHCFSSHVTSFILDGEMMGWDKKYQCFGSKGMAFDVKKLTEKSQFQPCFCAFDILYFNGRSLVGSEENDGMKLCDRLKLLDAMFVAIPGVIQRSTRTIANNSKDVLKALNNAIENHEEGIVMKDVASYYIANKRNAGWYKIKPEYTDSAMNDLDLVIIGVNSPTAPRHGWAKSFLVAVADSDTGEQPTRWVCVGSVATGLTMDERDSVCAMLSKNWKVEYIEKAPPELVFNKTKPSFWIMPEHSIVVTVRATALIRSTSFGANYTMYFPRITCVREDKPYGDVMTLKEFNKLVECANPVVKLATKRIGDDVLDNVEAKIRKKRAVNLPQVPEEMRMITDEVEVVSQALMGRKICILSDDDEERSKENLVKIVMSHGGKVVANPGYDTWCCVVGRNTFRARNVIASQACDVTTTAWLRALPYSPRPVLMYPIDLVAVAKRTKYQYSREYDNFGDHFLQETDNDKLKKCFDKIERDEIEIYLTKEEMLDIDRELFGDHNPHSFLRPCYLHMTGDPRSLLAIVSTFYGATLCDITDSNLTHVVVPSTTPPEEIRTIKGMMVATKALVVTEEWLEKCHLQGKLASDTIHRL